MKLPPRTTHALALALLCAFAPPCVNALRLNAALQSPQQPNTNTKRAAKPRRQRDAKTREQREREQAVAALREAAEAVRPADDLYESVRLRAEAADLLWPYDAAAARVLLRGAWEAVNAPGAADRITGFEEDEDPRGEARRALEDMHRAVVKVAHKHDAPLAEELMHRFERELPGDEDAPHEDERVEAAPSSSNGDDARALSRAGWRRLLLARDLLGDDEHARAAATAAPLVAEGPTVPLLDFIHALRIEAPRESDALYLSLLARTRSDAAANANDVLLLSAPIVSPTLRTQIGADGSVRFVSTPRRGDHTATPLPAEVRRAFYDAAASVLLRPHAVGARPATETARLYFTAARLLPFFEREAPRHAPALHALVAALAADLEAGRRDTLSSQAGVKSLTPQNPTDPLAPLLKSIADAPNAVERDRERFNSVTVAAERGLWDRAGAVASEIEDEETRRNARRAIAIEQVMDTLRAFGDEDAIGKQQGADEDDAERAAQFVRAADVPAEVRAAGLAQAAELAARRGRRARAEELFAEAASYAEQSGREDFHRPHVFAFVALSAARAGSARTWELLPALVRGANETDDFELVALSLHYEFKHLGRGIEFWAWQGRPGSLDLRHVFAAAARLDFARALAEARAFKDGVVRGNVLLAVARTALPRKEKTDAKTAP